MSTEITTAIMAGIVALVSVVISIYGQIRQTRLEHQLIQTRESQTKQAKAAAVIAKYRDPLFRAALDLQRVLYSITHDDFLRKRYNKDPAEWSYAVQYTLYVIAEFLGWLEVLRREVQFLDLGEIETSRRLQQLFDKITQIFIKDGINVPFYLHRGEQSAIGEVMLSTRRSGEEVSYECIGYAVFVKSLSQDDFVRWFARLTQDIERVASEAEPNEKRLAMLQESIYGLIEFLDPDGIRWPKDQWRKPN